MNETFVRQYLDPATALGTVVRTIAEPDTRLAIAKWWGSCATRSTAACGTKCRASAFVPFSQHPAPQPWAFLAIRSAAPLASLTPALTRASGEAGVMA